MFLNTFQVQGNFESHGSTADSVLTQTMTVDDLSSSYTVEESLAVLHQKGATGRRCHKTLKGGGEAVWPPNLEAALIAGLQVYSDRHRAHMRHRGRFIGRNHFLAAYVRSLTGRYRSAKQVGSRLQQLKDTCRELEILYLITGTRNIFRRRDPRRGRKPRSKTSSRRSMSSTPELSDCSSELTPEPEVQSIPQYATPASQSEVYSPEAVEPEPSSSYASPTECSYESYPVEHSVPVSVPVPCYPTSSQYYSQVQEWPQSSTPAYMTTQQWGNYYAQVEPQQQYAYYDSQCY